MARCEDVASCGDVPAAAPDDVGERVLVQQPGVDDGGSAGKTGCDAAGAVLLEAGANCGGQCFLVPQSAVSGKVQEFLVGCCWAPGQTMTMKLHARSALEAFSQVTAKLRDLLWLRDN